MRTSPFVGRSIPGTSPERGASIGLAVWLIVVVSSMVWPALWPLDPETGIGAAPFYGSWMWHATGWLAVVGLVGVLVVAIGPRVAAALPPPWLPAATGAAATVWVTLVAASDGIARLGESLLGRHQYLPLASRIDPGDFVATFVERAAFLPTHVKGHPPGATLAFWLLDRAGFGSPGLAALAVVVAWGIGITAVAWAVADVGGAAAARRVAPFLVLLPAVVWAGTSADAIFMAATASAIALVIVATGHTDARRSIPLAISGGLLFGMALHLTYGAVPLLVIPILVAHRRRSWELLALAAAGMAIVTLGFTAAGFWWFDGLSATRGFYREGLASIRPYGYFVVVGNLGALAFAVGPAVAGGLGAMVARAQRHPELLLCAGATIAVLAADISGLSKGEVERIWLPFVPWLAVGAAALPRRATSWWLSAQLLVTLCLQAWLETPW